MTEPTNTQLGSGTSSAAAKTPAPLPYALLASYTTVQVVSPTLVNDVLYCTVSTLPSGVIASLPVPQGEFESVLTSVVLEGYALAIEEVMKLPSVTAGSGIQTIDTSGLLADAVSFTVQYVQSGTSGTSVTAQAVVPVTELQGVETSPGVIDITAAKAIIDGVYASLQNAAGG